MYVAEFMFELFPKTLASYIPSNSEQKRNCNHRFSVDTITNAFLIQQFLLFLESATSPETYKYPNDDFQQKEKLAQERHRNF